MALSTTTTWWGVVLDAPDGPALAHFYARLLGWKVFNEDADGAAVAPSEAASYNLACQTEEHYVRPVWPTVQGAPQMSMHLDIEVDDLDAAVAHAVEVGAELATHQPQDTVRVMLDPAGHPFCLYLDERDWLPSRRGNRRCAGHRGGVFCQTPTTGRPAMWAALAVRRCQR